MSVANNAEAVGRLLATSSLMKGDRELMRKQSDPPAQESTESAPQPSSSPISHDAKAIEAVLLKLLNERLQASDIEAMNLQGARSAADKAAADEATTTPKHITARYTEDGLTSNNDPVRPETIVPLGQSPLRDVIPRAAPELQSFIQRLAALAAGTADSSAGTGVGGARDRKSSAAPGNMAIVRIMIAALVLLGFSALISGWLPG